jgi:hypothetical protein
MAVFAFIFPRYEPVEAHFPLEHALDAMGRSGQHCGVYDESPDSTIASQRPGFR